MTMTADARYTRLILAPAPHFSYRHWWEVAPTLAGPWRLATEEEIEALVPWVAALCSGIAIRRGL